MKLLRALLLPLLLVLPTQAQFKDPGLSFGAGGGGFLGQSDDLSAGVRVKNKIQLAGRAFLRYGLVRHLQAEVDGGLGQIRGQDVTPYKTTLIPLSFRLLLSPLELEGFNPYIYAGYGALHYKVQTNPNLNFVNPVPKREGWAGFVPAGAGFQIRMDDNFSLEASGGFNYVFSDNIDYYSGGSQKDALWSAVLGITYTVESGDVDSDGDGLPNRLEKQIGTDPKKADTDGDGLSDGDEYFRYHTDPRKADTDGDGLTDGDEVMKYKTNPLKQDTDGDGLNDREEVAIYHTDPLKADTDMDGLTDGDEVLKYKTDPLKADTDGDGLTDGDEVTRYKTDPLKVDTDGGGVNDAVEVARGTNPLDPSDDIKKEEPKIGKRIVLEGVNFKTGSAELSPESVAKLEEVFLTLKDNPEIEVEISGYTDNRGKRSVNTKLSKARAEAVKTYLVTRGVDPRRIRTVGYGPDKPLAPNTTEEGRSKNRRIEFSRTK